MLAPHGTAVAKLGSAQNRCQRNVKLFAEVCLQMKRKSVRILQNLYAKVPPFSVVLKISFAFFKGFLRSKHTHEHANVTTVHIYAVESYHPRHVTETRHVICRGKQTAIREKE